MSVDAGFLGLGTLEDLWDADLTAWSYPTFRTETPLIGNGADTGNLLIQESAKPLRERTLSFTAESAADRDTVRGYYEDADQVTFTDYDATTCDVLVLDFASSDIGADLHTVRVRLKQLTEPTGP